MANDMTENYDLGVEKGMLREQFQDVCSVTASIDRHQHALGLRPDMDGKPVLSGTEAACPPEGSAERNKMDQKLNNLRAETDGLYNQRSAITLGAPGR